MALSAYQLDPQSAAQKAVAAIGSGYDLCYDLRLNSCKPVLIELDRTRTRDLVVPGGAVVPNVSTSIKCDKGERTKFRSDVVSFNQVLFLCGFFLAGSGLWVLVKSIEELIEAGFVNCYYFWDFKVNETVLKSVAFL